jgi:hypothetical protein
MRHGHPDLGQLDDLVRMVGLRFGKRPLPTGTGLRLDLDDLRRRQPRLAMAGVPWLGARSPSRARAGDPLHIRGIGQGGTIGVAGVLGQPRFQRGCPLLLLLDHREQMNDHLAHDERGPCPTGGVQRKPCWH